MTNQILWEKILEKRSTKGLHTWPSFDSIGIWLNIQHLLHFFLQHIRHSHHFECFPTVERREMLFHQRLEHSPVK